MVIFLREAITNYVDLYWKPELIEINWSLWEKQNKQMCNWLELRCEVVYKDLDFLAHNRITHLVEEDGEGFEPCEIMVIDSLNGQDCCDLD